MKFVYPAIFYQGKSAVTVHFPDVACLTQGDDYLDAFKNARECLSLHIYGSLRDGDELLPPSRLEDVELEEHEALALIEVDLDGYKPDWSLEE